MIFSPVRTEREVRHSSNVFGLRVLRRNVLQEVVLGRRSENRTLHRRVDGFYQHLICRSITDHVVLTKMSSVFENLGTTLYKVLPGSNVHIRKVECPEADFSRRMPVAIHKRSKVYLIVRNFMSPRTVPQVPHYPNFGSRVLNGTFRPKAVNGGPSNPNANGFFSTSSDEIVPLAIASSFLGFRIEKS